MINFPVSLTLRLDWSEMDMFGHINNVSFFKYMQAARVNYWEQTGIYAHYLETNMGPILASAQCSFYKPLHYPGQIEIKTRMEFIKNSSFGLHHHILDHESNLCAEAHDIMVMYDFNNSSKIPLPQQLRHNVEIIEARIF